MNIAWWHRFSAPTGPPPCRASVLCPLQFQLLGDLPYTDRPQHAHRQHRGEGFPRSAPAPDPGSRHLHAGHRLARTAGTRQTHPGARSRPRFRCHPHAFGTSAVVHSRSPSRLAPDTSCAPFPQCSPPRLIHRSSLRRFRTSPCVSGPGGPTSITSAAPQPATQSSTSHPPAVFVAHEPRRPSPPPSVPAAPSTRPGGRTSDTAAVPSQASDPASPATTIVGVLAGQLSMPRFGTPQVSPGCVRGSRRCGSPCRARSTWPGRAHRNPFGADGKTGNPFILGAAFQL